MPKADTTKAAPAPEPAADNPPPGSTPPGGGSWTWADGAWRSLDEPAAPPEQTTEG